MGILDGVVGIFAGVIAALGLRFLFQQKKKRRYLRHKYDAAKISVKTLEEMKEHYRRQGEGSELLLEKIDKEIEKEKRALVQEFKDAEKMTLEEVTKDFNEIRL